MSGPALQAIGNGASSLLGSTDNIGRSAEAIFSQKVTSHLTSLYGSVGAATQLPRALANIRQMAKTIVVLSYLAVAVVAVFFALGAYHAIDLYFNPPEVHCPPGYFKFNGRCLKSSLNVPGLTPN